MEEKEELLVLQLYQDLFQGVNFLPMLQALLSTHPYNNNNPPRYSFIQIDRIILLLLQAMDMHHLLMSSDLG